MPWVRLRPLISTGSTSGYFFDIQAGCVIRGALPFRQLKLILAWCELHRDELMQNWELAKDAKPLNHIAPLV